MNAPERVLRKITSDSLATYLAEIRRQSVPTPAEEVALGRRIQAGDAEALRALVERNLRFVVQVANNIRVWSAARRPHQRGQCRPAARCQ
jgi:DNA-directed RNA polymerase sigma subunit (sigma70/sigma32)